MERKIIIAAIIIVLAILVGMIVFTSGSAKDDTVINFLSNSSLKNGDAVKFQLTDSKGNLLAIEEIIIELDYNGTVERYSISTDANGTGSLILNELDSGNYKVNVIYNGNDKYAPTSASQALIVGGDNGDSTQDYSSSSQQTYSSDQSSSSSNSGADANSNTFDYNGGGGVSENANQNGTG